MSIPTNTTVRVRRRIPGVIDRYGNETVVFTDPGPAKAAWLEQTTEQEVTFGANTAITDWLLAMPGAPELSHLDRLLTPDDAEYEVIGRPDYARQPGGNVHHVQARLRLRSV